MKERVIGGWSILGKWVGGRGVLEGGVCWREGCVGGRVCGRSYVRECLEVRVEAYMRGMDVWCKEMGCVKGDVRRMGE